MRSVIFSLFLMATAALGPAAEIEFVRVWPGWRDADSFDRISEYFGRGENTGGQLVLRTKADARAGYYFLVRIKSTTALPVAKFEVSVVRPDNPEAQVHAFTTSLPAKETVVQLGVTGTDWPAGAKANPVAWRIALLAPDGKVIGERQSFLWAKPAK